MALVHIFDGNGSKNREVIEQFLVIENELLLCTMGKRNPNLNAVLRKKKK